MASTSRTASATVTAVSPLTIRADGASVACPAEALAEVAALRVGQRVTVEDRSPRRPLITGTIV